MSETPLSVRVVEKYRISNQSVGLELVAEDGGTLPPFTAGAYVDVDLGYGMIRQYSLANSPAETRRYLLGVLKVPGSQGISAALHDVVCPGNVFRISAPKNLFPLDESAGFTLLIGGGIGITPMLSFAHRLHDLGRPFALHFCARDRDHAPFVDLLPSLPFFDRVETHFDDDPASALELSDRLADVPANTHLYVCGPNGFMESVMTAAARHLPPEQLHQESFDPPAALEPSVATANTAFEVELRSSGEVITVAADQSLVEALQQNGIPIPRGCPRAFCGSCAVTVLEGEVDHRDTVLPDHVRNEMGKMLSCVSRARSQRLLLDL